MLALWAVHISDNVLATGWWAGGLLVAAVLAVLGAWRIRDEEIPRVALLTAAFFVASSFHVRVGPTSVHLLLNGLVGVLLGVRACLAIPVGLLMQYLLLQHGGFYTLGVNSCVMTLPALGAWLLFRALGRLPWLRRPWFTWLLGALVGGGTVLATIALNCVVLLLGGETDWSVPALVLVVLYLPLAAIEAVVVGFAVGFLTAVKPEMLGLPPEPPAPRAPPERETDATATVAGDPPRAAGLAGEPDPAAHGARSPA